MSIKIKFLSIIAIIVLGFVLGMNNVSAQTTPTCPVGYICTPVTPQVVNCPTGYICTPASSTPSSEIDNSRVTDATANVVSSNLEIVYDNNKEESLLRANFRIIVNGGKEGIFVYKRGSGYQFVREDGKSVHFYTDIGLEPTSAVVTKVTDQYGQEMYVIPANRVVPFTSSITTEPKKMFAGTYSAQLTSLYFTQNTKDNTNARTLLVRGNKTNSKTIIGEVSPYISFVSNPIKVGERMSVSGERLWFGSNSFTTYIDGQPVDRGIVDGTKDGSTIFFTLPYLVDGSHVLYVADSKTGSSNKISFQVGNVSVSKPSINVMLSSRSNSYIPGSYMDINWTTTNIYQDYLDVVRLRGDREYNLAYSIKNDGSERVYLPADLPNGWYTLEIKSSVKGYPDAVIGSTGQFSIAQASSHVYPTEVTSTVPISTYPSYGSYGEYVTFRKQFSITNANTPTLLALAADNQYVVSINGKTVDSSTGDWNFNSVHLYNVSQYVQSGNNTLEVKVFNNYATGAAETGLGNPAGLIYKIAQNSCTSMDCLNSASLVTSSDGQEAANGRGQAVVLSKQDPLWVSINGAKWIWTKDYYAGGTVIQPPPPTANVNVSNTSAQLGSPIMSNNVVVAYPLTFNLTLSNPGPNAIYVPAYQTSGGPITTLSSSQNLDINYAGITVSPSSIAGDSYSSFVIPTGSSRSFSVNLVVKNLGEGGTKFIKVSGISYGTNPSQLQTNNITTGLEKLYLNFVFGNGSTNSTDLLRMSNPIAQVGPSVTNGDITVAYPVSFSFTLTAGEKDIYISTTPSIALTTSGSGFNPLPVLSSVIVEPPSVITDSSYAYVIPAYKSRTFKYYGSINASDSSSSGIVMRSFQIDRIHYGLAKNEPRTYSIEAGSSLKTTVVIGPASDRPPVVSLNVYPNPVTVNQTAKLSWSAANANSCVGSGFRTYNAVSGNQSIVLTVPATVTYSVTCIGAGGSKTESVTLTSVGNTTNTQPPSTNTTTSVTPTTVSAPTATFTIEGQKSYTYNVGQTNNYVWSSTNADRFSSSYTSTGPAICGGGPWVANSAKGSSSTYISSSYAGCTWTVTYTATNSQTGQSASDTVVVKVNPLPETTTPTPTNSSSVWDAFRSIFSR